MDYRSGASVQEISREIQRLAEEKFLTQVQADLINCETLARFFATPIGQKLRTGTPYLREFKFSILEDAGAFGPELEGEQILLQGVVDCALLEPEGITVLDFKTDGVTEETLAHAVEKYRPQVQTYGRALSRIYEMPVIHQYLYFFHLKRFAEV